MPAKSDCPFCLGNNLLDAKILAETDGGFLIPAKNSVGNFLVVPKIHAETPADLPDIWWADFKELLGKAPINPEHYNISLNIGKNAGQTVKHIHFWIIPRQANVPAAGKGLAGLIDSANRE